ncbi:MAG: segregation/condensation protein A [Lachnospiraceae bacterium]|nr:segregation/condensation protein A [Lachnospiraceae bacterium]
MNGSSTASRSSESERKKADSTEPQYKLEIYEGPLDLLLALISKNKIDISDIPIALILEQYLAYLDEMRSFDLEISGDFIVMASELMLIKSRMLLPKPPEEDAEDPREQLARALIEYKRAKEAMPMLNERYRYFGGRVVKDSEVIDTSGDPVDDMDVELLKKAFDRIIQRTREMPRMEKASELAIQRLLAARVVPVSERIAHVMRSLYRKGPQTLETLLLECDSRSSLIATFLGILELMRSQRVKLRYADEDYTDAASKPELVLLILDRSHKRLNKNESETENQ